MNKIGRRGVLFDRLRVDGCVKKDVFAPEKGLEEQPKRVFLKEKRVTPCRK